MSHATWRVCVAISSTNKKRCRPTATRAACCPHQLVGRVVRLTETFLGLLERAGASLELSRQLLLEAELAGAALSPRRLASSSRLQRRTAQGKGVKKRGLVRATSHTQPATRNQRHRVHHQVRGHQEQRPRQCIQGVRACAWFCAWRARDVSCLTSWRAGTCAARSRCA